MNNIEKEFDIFEEGLKVYSKVKKVNSITRRFLSEEEYGNYTIEQFLVLYKLNRMEKLGVVNQNIASTLKEMLDMKRHVATVIGDEAKRAMYDPAYNATDLSKLHDIDNKINNHLKKYHLTIEDISLKDIVDTSIMIENNELTKEGFARTKRID